MPKEIDLSCVCCGKPAEFRVALITRNDRNENERYSLPHRALDNTSADDERLGTTPFCQNCMQSVGNAIRATIRNLQYDHGRNEQRFRQSIYR
ncbi:hypothetical protein [Novosphingobium sp. P6W]|uniref:hypothetical protein n=1 Tax=Novosphingobium sp. P6W TaxID=1609758 RepID=UPI000AF2BF4F|nr:hypothetical protein [Novosphingobium sp. P6W]